MSFSNLTMKITKPKLPLIPKLMVAFLPTTIKSNWGHYSSQRSHKKLSNMVNQKNLSATMLMVELNMVIKKAFPTITKPKQTLDHSFDQLVP